MLLAWYTKDHRQLYLDGLLRSHLNIYRGKQALLANVGRLTQWQCFCAKRSFQSVGHENLLSVRSVRIIIGFCEEDMEDGRMLLSNGSLNS